MLFGVAFSDGESGGRDINGDYSGTNLIASNDWERNTYQGTSLFTNLNFDFQCTANFANVLPRQAINQVRFEDLVQRYWQIAARAQPAMSTPRKREP